MLDQAPLFRRRVSRYRGRNRGGIRPDVLMQDDPPYSYYCLVLAIDEATGANPGDDQVHVTFDAGYVIWYRQLANPLAPPALNGQAMQSGASLLELIQTPAQHAQLSQDLAARGHRGLEESTWWMLTSTYDLRASVRLEQFQPPVFAADPASVGHPNSRRSEFFVLPRLVVPRNPMRQILFALRELI